MTLKICVNIWVFSACAVTRAQARKFEDEIDLSDSLIVPVFTGEQSLSRSGVPDTLKTLLNLISNEVKAVIFTPENSSIVVNRKQMSDAQQCDPLLRKCFNSAVSQEVAKEEKVAYFIDDGLLMRKWCSSNAAEGDWSSVFQIVIPVVYRTQVLQQAHDHQLAGHLGITKTYDRILRHFFWQGLKKDVAEYCRTCPVCQQKGNPNQVISPAPLVPFPAIGEPFEHVIS